MECSTLLISAKMEKCSYFWLNYIVECSTLLISAKMEKCLYFWLNYIVECSTLSISANNGKVFVFLVRLYSGVFHLIDFSLMVNFSSLWGWEGDWSPTGCIAVFYVWGLVTLPDVLLYIMCGNWSRCLSFAD